MKKEYFLRYVDKSAQQVFVMQTRTCLPLSLFVHTYLVTNDHGTLTRWDVWHRQNVGGESVGHVHRNSALPWQGISMLYFGNLFAHPFRFRPRIMRMIGGEDAQCLIATLSDKGFDFPYREGYRFRGPNSNTFTAWILSHAGDYKNVLPWNALGKSFKEKL